LRRWLWLLAALAGAVLGLALGTPEPAQTCGNGCAGGSLKVKFLTAFTNDDAVVNQPALDPHDNGVDPGYDKGVASCRAWLPLADIVQVEVRNGYPSYTCRFWARLKNTGTSSVSYVGSTIAAPGALTVGDVSGSTCLWLKPGERRLVSFTVHVEQGAHQMAVYTFDVQPRFKAGGCTG